MRLVFLILLLATATAFGAATAVDKMLSFEAGADNDAIDTTYLNANDAGSDGTWGTVFGTPVVSTDVQAPHNTGSFNAGGTLVGPGGTRCMEITHAGGIESIRLTLPSDQDTITCSGWFMTTIAEDDDGLYDMIGGEGPGGEYMYAQMRGSPALGLRIWSHSAGGDGEGDEIAIDPNVWYRFDVKHIRNDGVYVSMRLSDGTVVGTSYNPYTSDWQMDYMRVGNINAHGATPDSLSYFDNVVWDYTTAAYPVGSGGRTTYYVRTDGNDANAGTANSSGGAWLTINKGTDTILAGDTLRVQAGTYTGAISSTTAGVDVALKYHVADGAVIVENEWTVTGDYQVFVGFTVDGENTRDSGFLIQSADYCEWWNNTVRNAAFDSWRGDNGAGTQQSHGCLFIGNVSTNSGLKAFQIRGTNNIVAYNESSHDQTDFVYFTGGRHRYLNNYSHDINADVDSHTDMFQNGTANGLGNHDMLFEANLYLDYPGSDHHGGNVQNSGDSNDARHIVRRNVWVDNGSYTYGFSGDAFHYVKIYNDTVVDSEGYYPNTTSCSSMGGDNLSWRNNIFWQAWGTSVATAVVYDENTGHDSDFNLFYDTGGNISYSATINAEANSLLNSNPLLTDRNNDVFTLGALSPAIGEAGPLTLVNEANGTGTEFDVDDGSFFVGDNTWITQYGGNLVVGDKITVGTDQLTISSVTGNTITVTSSFTWTDNDPVYYGWDTTPDIGAYPYSHVPLTAATYVASGSDYTVTPTGDTRFVVFYEDGIPMAVDNASPYEYSAGAGAVTMKAYPLYASQTLSVTATLEGEPEPPATSRMTATTINVGTLNGQ